MRIASPGSKGGEGRGRFVDVPWDIVWGGFCWGIFMGTVRVLAPSDITSGRDKARLPVSSPFKLKLEDSFSL